MKELDEIQKMEDTFFNLFYDIIVKSEYSDWVKNYSYHLCHKNFKITVTNCDKHFALDLDMFKDEGALDLYMSVFHRERRIPKSSFKLFFADKRDKLISQKLKHIVDTYKQETKINSLKQAMSFIPVDILRREKLKDIKENNA